MDESLKGCFLLAGKMLRDDNFYRTVVLMIEHGPEGAMGLVVNRPSTVTVANAVADHFELPETDEVVYIGGPVEAGALFVVHNVEQFNPDDDSVVPGLYVGSSADVFERVIGRIGDDDPDLKFRVFSGCAGWAPGQLEGELAVGGWHVLPASGDEIINGNPYALWDTLLEQVHEQNRIVPQPPADPRWN